MYQYQFETKGFEWTEINKQEEGVIAFKRKGKYRDDDLLVVLNTSNKNHQQWKMTVKGKNHWKEIFNSNLVAYWGTGENINENLTIIPVDKKKKICEIIIDIPALSAMIFR